MRRPVLVLTTLGLTVLVWHLAIESSIASKGNEPSPFGWFFFPALLIVALVNVAVGAALTRRPDKGHLGLLLLAELVVGFGYATLYRASHHVVAQDMNGVIIDISASVWALPVLGVGMLVGHRVGSRPAAKPDRPIDVGVATD